MEAQGGELNFYPAPCDKGPISPQVSLEAEWETWTRNHTLEELDSAPKSPTRLMSEKVS